MGDQNKQITKKQHFVPQFYLKNFANQAGFIQVLDLENRRVGAPKPFGSVCYEKYFYSIKTGKYDQVGQEIEDYFKILEDRLAPRYNKFIKNVLDNVHISEEELYYVSCFMSMMWIRSKYFRENMNRMNNEMHKKMNKMRASDDDFEDYLRSKINKKGGNKEITDEDIKIYKEVLISGDYDFNFSNKSHLLFLKDIEGFANLFFAKNWRAYFAPAGYKFITSDTPVSEMVPPKTGFWGADFFSRKHYLTLTPDIVIELVNPISGKKFKRKRVDKTEVLKLNLMRANLSLDYCYGQRKEEFEEMIRFTENRKNNLYL